MIVFTIRFARSLRRKLIIIWPDGSTSRENFGGHSDVGEGMTDEEERIKMDTEDWTFKKHDGSKWEVIFENTSVEELATSLRTIGEIMGLAGAFTPQDVVEAVRVDRQEDVESGYRRGP